MKGKKIAISIISVVLVLALGATGVLLLLPDHGSSGGSKKSPSKTKFNTYEDQVAAMSEELDNLKELNNGQLPVITLNSETSAPNFILGTYSEVKVSNSQDALESLQDVDVLMGIQDVKAEYAEASTFTFGGTTQYRLQQMYNEYVVYGQQLVVTADENGKVTSLSGDYATIGTLFDSSVNVSERQAISKAMEAGLSSDQPECTLVAYTLDGYNEMAYVLESDAYIYIVSAKSGDILSTEDRVLTALPSDISDSNAGSYTETIGRDNTNSSNNMFNTVFYDYDNNSKTDTYLFYDAVRNIVYHDLEMSSDHIWNILAKTTPLQDSDNIWTTNGAEKAIELYRNLANTYDFYLNVLGLMSYDGNGSQILAFVNDGYDRGYNAFNWGPQTMDLTPGDSVDPKTATILSFGGIANYQANLGVVGHEFTHAVENSLSLLLYKSQSGALKEAYSDVMGELIEAYYNGNYTDWVHGERNIKSPGSSTSSYFNIKYPQKLNGAGYYIGKDDNSGVHHNSTVVSHAIYEIYTSGLQDIPTLTELLYRSWGYLTRCATFYDYRMAMLASAQMMDLDDEVFEWINNAFDKADIVPVELPDDYLQSATANWNIADATTKEAIAGADITVSTVGANPLVVAQAKTDETGKTTMSLQAGTYYISISASGYHTANFVQVFGVGETADIAYFLQDENTPTTDELVCELGGIITDALNGQSLSNVSMLFRKGYMITSGSVDLVLYTNDYGEFYTNELDYGYYTIELQKDGYISSYVVVQAAASNWDGAEREDALNQSYSISPQLEVDDALRIVLTWGYSPWDLDSHLIGPRADGSKYHVCYYDPSAYDNGERIAMLDVDDTSSYGPETVTVNLANQNDLYHYYVHDYTNGGKTNNTQLASSGATVQVFSGSRLIATYQVPTDGIGTVWHVFDYDPVAGCLITINTFVSESAIS